MNRWIFGIISVLVAIGCVRLGFWQLARLGERQLRNAEVVGQFEQTPLDLRRADTAATYRRVTGRGVYDTTVTVVEVLRVSNGAPGVYVVSPLLLPDGRGVLVERGWVGAPDGRTVDLTALRWRDTVVVDGFVTPLLAGAAEYDGDWPVYVRGANPTGVAARVSYPLLPILVRRSGGDDHPGLQPLAPPELTNGPHLSYAVQWFAFAVVALVGTAAYLRSAGKARRVEGPIVPPE